MEIKNNSLIILIIFNFIFGKNKYISFIIVVIEYEYSDYFCNVNIGVFCKFGLVIDKVIFYF